MLDCLPGVVDSENPRPGRTLDRLLADEADCGNRSVLGEAVQSCATRGRASTEIEDDRL